jgi:transposase-like protein
MIALACPYCGNTKDVIKFGTNRSGTARSRCRGCGKTFTPHPHSRAMTPQKQEQILLLLQERVSQRGIARALKVGRQTIRAIRKKGLSG